MGMIYVPKSVIKQFTPYKSKITFYGTGRPHIYCCDDAMTVLKHAHNKNFKFKVSNSKKVRIWYYTTIDFTEVRRVDDIKF